MTAPVKPEEITAFLKFAPQPTRALGAALPALVTPEVTSPWTPRGASTPVPPPAPSTDELAALSAQARELGHAQGLEDTAALRAQLAEVIDQLVGARAAIVAPAAELIAELSSCVIESWIEAAGHAALFAPIVRTWLTASDQPATVRVHPDDVAALTALIGEAPLEIVGDAALAPGALVIRGATLESTHDWRARLPELRTAIAAAIAGDADAKTAPAPVPAEDA